MDTEEIDLGEEGYGGGGGWEGVAMVEEPIDLDDLPPVWGEITMADVTGAAEPAEDVEMEEIPVESPPRPTFPTLASFGEPDSADVHSMRNDPVNEVLERIVQLHGEGVRGVDIPPVVGGTHDAPMLGAQQTPHTGHPLARVLAEAHRKMEAQPLDARCTAMLQSFQETTRGLTLHSVLGNSVPEEDLRLFLAGVAQDPTYLEKAASVMRSCHAHGLSFPPVEPMPVHLEDDFRRPPDPGAPWELECPGGQACVARDLCSSLGVPAPWTARAWVPIFVLTKHWELQSRVLAHTLTHTQAREASAALHQQYGPPLPCVLCQCYEVTRDVVECDRDHVSALAREGDGGGDTVPPRPSPSTAVQPVRQCFMHLFNMEGEYREECKLPGVGRFVGLIAPLAEFNASGYVYVAEAHPRLLGDGPNLPAFRLSADRLFQ